MTEANPMRIGHAEANDNFGIVRKAQEAIFAAHEAGLKAVAEACGPDFAPPQDLTGAAEIIARLRAENASLKSDAEVDAEAFKQLSGELAKSIKAEIAAELVGANAFTAMARNMADSIRDTGLKEVPGNPGYFAGADTPMLRAAEAAAIVTHCKVDRMAQEGYLRKRGWRFVGNGAWRERAEPERTLPFNMAVESQVRIDSMPFRPLAAECKDVRSIRPAPVPAEREMTRVPEGVEIA